jgi:hypothetical protein
MVSDQLLPADQLAIHGQCTYQEEQPVATANDFQSYE